MDPIVYTMSRKKSNTTSVTQQFAFLLASILLIAGFIALYHKHSTNPYGDIKSTTLSEPVPSYGEN